MPKYSITSCLAPPAETELPLFRWEAHPLFSDVCGGARAKETKGVVSLEGKCDPRPDGRGFVTVSGCGPFRRDQRRNRAWHAESYSCRGDVGSRRGYLAAAGKEREGTAERTFCLRDYRMRPSSRAGAYISVYAEPCPLEYL